MPERGAWFQRLGTLPAYANSSPDDVASAEIAAATGDGRTLVYTDSPGGRLGLVELDRLGRPRPAGTIAVPGEPTSVDVLGHLALTVVDTSASFTDPSGVLQVLDLRSRQVVATHDLRGQPDSVDLSPDGRYAAVAIENERDEDVNDGQLPQLPGGHLAVVDLRKGEVVNHFPAGEATVEGVDTVEDGEIRLDGTVTAAREPDGVAWVDDHHLATADEGDLQGGSRTWTVFDSRTGAVVFSSGAELERLAVRYGQYPEFRAEDKGVEPEGVAVATYHGVRYAFIGMERANLVAVYRIGDPRHPGWCRRCPPASGPRGCCPCPSATGWWSPRRRTSPPTRSGPR